MFAMNALKTIWTEKVSLSSTVIFISSIIIRFLAMGCIALAFYMKYGDKVIDDTQLPALDSIELHGIPLGSFIQGLVFSSVMVFFMEVINGVFGIVACLKKKKIMLYVYICLCFGAILVYIVHVSLWGVLYDGVGSDSQTSNNSVSESFYIYYRRYQERKLVQKYENIWRNFYSNFSCCGGSGENFCTNVGTFPGCYDRFSGKLTTYMQSYIGLFCIFIICQIVIIVVADYSIMKLHIKEEKKHVSTQKKSIFCMWDYGLCPILKVLWKRAPSCMLSVINKCANLLIMSAVTIVSIHLLASDLVDNSQLNTYFSQIKFYNYNFHDIMAGFGSGFLTIGCLSIGNSVIGLIGSKRNSVILHTVCFFLSCFLVVIKLITIIYWAVIYDQVTSLITDRLNVVTPTNSVAGSELRIFTNRLMVNFRCCEFSVTVSDKLCYSDTHESVVDMNIANYNNVGVYGTFNGYKKCGTAIDDKLRPIAICFFVFTGIGIICDILGLILISKEFKEGQQHTEAAIENTIKDMHLIPWLYKIILEKRPRSILVTVYIIITAFMMMLELTFIVLASIFSLSYYVDRDYIDSIGDVYKFLAIAGIVLVLVNIIIRIVGLTAVFNSFEKTLFVSTAGMGIVCLLNLAYIIMAAVLRHDEYPCSYTPLSSFVSHDCSYRLEATSGVAIGMFVIELVMMVVLVVIIHDRSYLHRTIDSVGSQETENKEKRGIYKTLYIFLFVERHIFKQGPKLVIPFVVYCISSVIMTLFEITFIVLVCFYGLSWHIDRSWITSGLYNVYEPTINLGELFDLLAIGSLVLVPIVSMNRIFGIVAVLKSRMIFLILTTIGLIVTTIVTFLFLVLSAFLLGYLYRCKLVTASLTTESCPHHKEVIVGVALAAFIMEFIMQIGTFVMNDRTYGYFPPYAEETADMEEENKTRQGMLTSLYDKVFKRRTPFRNASKLSFSVTVYIISSLVMLMIEITMIVLIPIYGLSWVMDRTWITSGLYNTFEGTLNLGLTFDFISIALLVLIPMIAINRFIGIAAINKRWKTVNYANFGCLLFSVILIVLFIVLSSIVLGLKYKCSYTVARIDQDCPTRMKSIIGVAIAFMALELLMQVYAIIIHDRAFQYFPFEKEESKEELITEGKGKTMFVFIYELFRRRETFSSAPKLEVFIASYVVCTLIYTMIEVTFIVLVSIYGLSWVMDRTWITQGLHNMYNSSMNLGQLFDFLAICSLVVIPIISISRFVGIIAVSTKRKTILYVNTALLFITLLVTVICLVLSSVLLYSEYRCQYYDSTSFSYQTCPRMESTVGVGVAMFITELIMQIMSLIVYDRSYKYIQSDTTEDIKQNGLFNKMIQKLILERKLMIEFNQLKIPTLVICIGCAALLFTDILFWIGTIIEMGSPRLMNGTLMSILYTQSMDDINLGHLADGIAYTAIGLIPVFVLVRGGGLFVMLQQKSELLVAAAVATVVLGLGCVTLFGLSTYHIQYVYSCFGSLDPVCESKVMGILLTTASVFLTFFLVETIVHILQSCLFFYVFGMVQNVSVKTVHFFQNEETSSRIMKIVHIVIRVFEMVISFMMLISLTFWLSGVHIHSDKSSLGDINFYDTNLFRLANGLVITSIVTISVILINNIVAIVSVLTGKAKALIVNTVIVGFCLVTESVSLGLQSKIQWHIYDRAISVYISFTVLQIVCQLIYTVLSVVEIKRKGIKNRIHDSTMNITSNRTITPATRGKVLETSLKDDLDVEEM